MPMTTTFFSKARNFSIKGGTFNAVQGDQYVITQVQDAQKRRRYIEGDDEHEEAEYEEYVEIKRGDILAVRDIHRYCEWRWDEEKKEHVLTYQCEKAVFTGELRLGRGSETSKFTIISYDGPDALKAWKADFREYSQVKRTDIAQLFGINRSRIPFLIFYGELVPAAQFTKGLGQLSRTYLELLRRQLGCDDSEMWMDPRIGVLCAGPEGPWCEDMFKSILPPCEVPTDVELLKEDVFLRYLASLRLGGDFDNEILAVLGSVTSGPDKSDLIPSRPSIVSAVTNTVIAVRSGSLWSWGTWDRCLGERDLLENGLNRFTLQHSQFKFQLQLDVHEEHICWLSQSLNIFHTSHVSLEDDLSTYKLILLKLNGTISPSRAKRRRRRRAPPIYLFIRPMSTSEPLEEVGSATTAFHFWSFDENGQVPMSNNTCVYLGLPVALIASSEQVYWPTHTYKTLREYLVAKRYDPATPRFARYLGYPLYEITESTSSRFEDIDDSAEEPAGAAESLETAILGTSNPQSTSICELADDDEDSLLALLFDGSRQDVLEKRLLDAGVDEGHHVHARDLSISDAIDTGTKFTLHLWRFWSSITSFPLLEEGFVNARSSQARGSRGPGFNQNPCTVQSPRRS
ncbi:hypothetical protein PM082_015550 [Marasmius tenuissimus]|nr:hypothetical protein PM082_015550 [Marasmius tenuissimus]